MKLIDADAEGGIRVNISRKRYVITKNNKTKILCGLAQNYHFKPIGEVKDTAIKTYRSEKQALSAMECWSESFTDGCEIVAVLESYEEQDGIAEISTIEPQKWIKINSREDLPKECGYYLVYTGNDNWKEVLDLYYCGNDQWEDDAGMANTSWYGVTHWMSLPEPPEKEN